MTRSRSRSPRKAGGPADDAGDRVPVWKALPYALLEKKQTAPDSWLLTFSLPEPFRLLGFDGTLPTGIKVHHPAGTDGEGKPAPLEKSYSPVSHPATVGTMELLVKEYEHRPAGGLGHYLCSMKAHETIQATLKGKRMIHGDAVVARRWAHVGLLGGGTGIAPLVQIARILLRDPADSTRVRVLSVNRTEADILMRAELDGLAAAHPDRFQVAYCLTAPPAEGWTGFTGRGSVEMIREALPPAGDGTRMVLLCGRDGFVETWAGPMGRAQNPDGSKGGKIQGPLKGLLADAGYDASEVYKY
jgi:cytochrome-b5 reductase